MPVDIAVNEAPFHTVRFPFPTTDRHFRTPSPSFREFFACKPALCGVLQAGPAAGLFCGGVNDGAGLDGVL